MSKYSTIADKLKEEIEQGKYSAAGKLPTEYELVTRFNVSRQTVRQAILSLKADGVVYQVQGSGTYISKDTSPARKVTGSSFKNIFVICTYISEYIFPSIIRGIESTLNGTGYRFNLAATGNKVDLERKILSDVIKLQECDGIIVEGSKTGLPNPNIGLYRKLEEIGIPVVFLHCAYQELENAIVVRQGLLRYAGFSEGLLGSGLGLESTDVRWYTTEDVLDLGMHIDDSIIRLIQNSAIDGVVCYNDLVASALIRDLTRLGLKVPRIVSFDDSYLCTSSAVPFVSLGHRKEELGVLAAQKIRNMVEGRRESSVFLPWITGR